jgi:hypothetical protein
MRLLSLRAALSGVDDAAIRARATARDATEAVRQLRQVYDDLEDAGFLDGLVYRRRVRIEGVTDADGNRTKRRIPLPPVVECGGVPAVLPKIPSGIASLNSAIALLRAIVVPAAADNDAHAANRTNGKPAAKGKRKRGPGRPRGYDAASDARMAKRWREAPKQGKYKPKFAKANGLTPRDFDKLLARVRKKRAEKRKRELTPVKSTLH